MRPAVDLPEVYLCREAMDFRLGIKGLAARVESVLQGNPLSGRLFVFINRRRDQIKILYWERNGFCLWQKRLEEDRFHWPRHLKGDQVLTLTGQELNWLLDGYDLRRWTPHPARCYSAVA
jgi:transposase